MRIALAADHAGYLLKDELARWLSEQGHQITDLGTNGPESVDYPEYGDKLARRSRLGRPSEESPSAARASAFRSPSTATPNAAARASSDPLSAQLGPRA